MDEKTEEKIVTAIANGETYTSQQEKYHISYKTVKNICDKHNIKSKYSDTKIEEIINIINENKVVSASTVSKILQRKQSNISEKMKRLRYTGKIKKLKIPYSNSKIKNDSFKKHLNRNLYYLSEKQLKQWIREQLPDNMPRNLQKSISNRLHDAGVDIDLSSNIKYKSIALPKKQYEELKKEAKNQNKTIKELILEKGGIKNAEK